MKDKKLQDAMTYSQKAMQALGSLAQGSQELREAWQHLKSATQKMEHQANKRFKQKESSQTLAQQWWGTIEANVAKEPTSKMTEQAAMRTLKELDKMLSAEQKKINELENKTKPQPKPDPADSTPPPASGQSGVFFG